MFIYKNSHLNSYTTTYYDQTMTVIKAKDNLKIKAKCGDLESIYSLDLKD